MITDYTRNARLLLTLSPYAKGYPLIACYEGPKDQAIVISYDHAYDLGTLRFCCGPHHPGAGGWASDAHQAESMLTFATAYAEYDFEPGSDDLGETPLPDADGEEIPGVRSWWREHGDAIRLEAETLLESAA